MIDNFQHGEKEKHLRGWIVRAEDNGLGILVDEEENEYVFNFGAIEDYRGQSVEGLGLKNAVRFVDFVVRDEKVVSIHFFCKPFNPQSKDTKTLSLDYRKVWEKDGRIPNVQNPKR